MTKHAGVTASVAVQQEADQTAVLCMLTALQGVKCSLANTNALI
jgi:hypothetical protein